MASMKKQRGMVFHQEGVTTPTAAAAGAHPPACLVVPKPGKTSKGGLEQSTPGAITEVDMVGECNMHPSKEASRMTAELPAMKSPTGSNLKAENLSPVSTCRGIRVTLDNNTMWNEFYRCKTEMILTKQGSRMFPYCRFRISGLQPSRKYTLIMDIQPLDNLHYKWTGKSWQVAGKAEFHGQSQPFTHPDSPATGQHWMQNPVSFYKLKLTDNTEDQEGNTILRPMHCYLPRLHVVQTDKAAKDIKLNGPSVVTFTFAQTEFMAVTAYQNSRFAQLKVDYNPFTKGLKEDSLGLKLRSSLSKDLHKDGCNEQHPLRKSLKFLLANHKPRGSKAADSKPQVSEDLPKNSTTNQDEPTSKVPEESSSRPAQKLFSELIREAHVSLQRCNLKQQGEDTSPSLSNQPINTQPTTLKSNECEPTKKESTSIKAHNETSEKKETVVTKEKLKEDEGLLKSLDAKGNVRTNYPEVSNVVAASAVSQNSADSDHCKTEVQSQGKVKQRPQPVPLPALALFLKQHSTKSKKAKSKQDSPLTGVPLEPLSDSPNSDAAIVCPASDLVNDTAGPLKAGYETKLREPTPECPTQVLPHQVVNNVPKQSAEMAYQPSSAPCQETAATKGPKEPRTDHFLASLSANTGLVPTVPDGTTVFNGSDQQYFTPEKSTSIISSSPTTSSLSPILSSPMVSVLPTSKSSQTLSATESSTLPSDSPTLKSDSLLPDPECPSFSFEPFSPASSPEPLPSLPNSLTLQLDSAVLESTSKAAPPKELLNSKNSTASVFRWHTVLPPSEQYIDSFMPFQPSPLTHPLPPVSSTLLPSTTPQPQTSGASTAAPPQDPASSFHENDQSLPFPADLSPLALQLPLSPTFSSLDGDVLSPTPSLTDLVHFFSNNEDLEMGVEFTNTETVAASCPPSGTAEEEEANGGSPQAQPVAAKKHYKSKKKGRRRKLAKTDANQNNDDSTYTSMHPNLEEVEEQLFISFTSKEALQLHLIDPQEKVSQTQVTPQVHLQETTKTPEKDKSLEVGASSPPDSFRHQTFAAKLWRLVDNPEDKAVSWDTDGEVIIVDQNVLESSIPSDTSDFRINSFSSFVRQLYQYGFKRVDTAAGDGGNLHRFSSPNFKHSRPELVASMRRRTVGNKTRPQADLSANGQPSSPKQRVDGGSDGSQRAETTEKLEEKIAAFEKILLRDLKVMRHRQVIHPVLQEVGLKLNLLDSTLAIDLRYLGVRLPIPPAGVAPSQGVCAAFVSRTGKTTDVTQIKGWREKFTTPEAPPTSAPPKPEAGPASDVPKRNLSAFCSDMLDEYLENEGKLIDERASSFSQPVVEPVAYELPTRSTSYVRTLDSILKKQPSSSPTSELISGFIPPSKRPKPTLRETKVSRRETTRHRAPKHTKTRSEPAADPNLHHKQQDQDLGPDPAHPHAFRRRRRRRLKPKTSSQTLSPSRSLPPPPNVSEDMAPLESDSEVAEQSGGSGGAGTIMTRAMLKQKDLEDGVVWEGKPRTSITEERASIALTSLFTLTGFERENPTAPIQLQHRRAPCCLNDFCRLGCICSSLTYSSRISHCGRPACMLGCSCLKQKVVLLKNLDGSDSSPSHHGHNRKRKRKRRMKMAYILKEADSVSQPAERVRSLWKRYDQDCDPDPIYIPKPAGLRRHTMKTKVPSSCARVRGYSGNRRIDKKKQKKPPELKASKVRVPKEAKSKTLAAPPGELVQPHQSEGVQQAPTPPSEPPPKPSKRLTILTECVWANEGDRSRVLKVLCQRMASNKLDRRFWIKKYLIIPMAQHVEGSGADRCVHYRIRITTPKMVKPAAPMASRPPSPPSHQKHMKLAGPLQDWQEEVEDDEVDPMKDCQQEVKEGENRNEEEAGSTVHQVYDGRSSREEVNMTRRNNGPGLVGMGLPFLQGISPAGFLSANRKQPGGTDHVIQVNGKLYPLAKIQLGKMGALHPANRLAAYLTGRVRSNRAHPSALASLAPSSSPQDHSSGGATQTAVPASSAPPSFPSDTTHRSQPTAQTLTVPTTASQLDGVAVPTVSLPLQGPQLLMVSVPPVPGKVPVLHAAPSPPAPPTGQKMVMQPVKKVSGVQYLRQPNGQLFQLVPLSQLTQVQLKPPPPRGPIPTSLPAAAHQTAVITAVSQSPPVATVASSCTTFSTSSSSSSFSSSSGSLSGLQPSAPPLNPHLVLPQKGASSVSILPPNSGKEPILISSPKAPCQPLVNVLVSPASFSLPQPPHPPTMSVNPSTGPGAQSGVNLVTTCVSPVGPGPIKGQQKSASAQTLPSNGATPSPTACPVSVLTPQPAVRPPTIRTKQELAFNLSDLDVICVVDDSGPTPRETGEGGTKLTPEVVDLLNESSGGETDHSSDFSDETDMEENKDEQSRQYHNAQEKKRREKLGQLFDTLRTEMGQRKSCSRATTLEKAVQVIQDLTATETDLSRTIARLMKRRDSLLRCLDLTQGSEDTAATHLVDLRDKPEKLMANSSEKEQVVVVAPKREEELHNDDKRLFAALVRPQSVEDKPHSDRGCGSVKAGVRICSLSSALTCLSRVMADSSSPPELLLEKARQEIQMLQRENHRLRSLKICMKQQRDASIRHISQSSGKSEQSILQKLQLLSSKLHNMEERRQAANQPAAAAGGRASDASASDANDDDVIITSYEPPLQTPQVPPTPVCSPPSTTPVQQPPSSSQKVLQGFKSTVALPAVYQTASAVRDRPKTMPNILSRSKKPAQQKNEFVQVVAPPEALSLFGAGLPGQQVLTLNLLGQTLVKTAPPPGSASAPLNIPNLTNQQLHLTAMPSLPTSNIYSSPASLTITNLTAENVLRLVQPLDTPPQQREVPVAQADPIPPPPPPPDVSAEAHQDPPPSQTRTSTESMSAVPSVGGPGESVTPPAEVTVGGPVAPVEAGEDHDQESLTSLLNEIVFLNQQTASSRQEEEERARSPWLLQLDSDSDDPINMETEEAGPKDHTPMKQSRTPPRPAHGTATGGTLVPPPLLQMKVGGGNVAAPAGRPMPRLVPLGLRGNPPT